MSTSRDTASRDSALARSGPANVTLQVHLPLARFCPIDRAVARASGGNVGRSVEADTPHYAVSAGQVAPPGIVGASGELL